MARKKPENEQGTAGTPAKPVRALRMDPKALMQAEKRSMAFELRLAGWMPDEIATHLGMSVPEVEKALQMYVTQVKAKDANQTLELRELELARIDNMFAGVYPSAVIGNVDSINSAVKLLELRAKITGSMENQPLVQQNFNVRFMDEEDEQPNPPTDPTIDSAAQGQEHGVHSDSGEASPGPTQADSN